MGFKINVTDRFRLYGIDTPETRTKNKKEKVAGLKAKNYVKDKIENKEIVIDTQKRGKFGRYLATIYYIENGKKVNLNKELIKKGLGVEYYGGKR